MIRTKSLLTTAIGLMLSTACLWASQPLFQARYDITSISDAPPGWQLQGTVTDNSPLGYGAPDVQIDDLIFCYVPDNGDIDRYRITNIVSASGVTLVCEVVYDEEGSPRFGAPMSGWQLICRPSSNGVPYLTSLQFGGFDEYLQSGARNLAADTTVPLTAQRWATYAAVANVDVAGKTLNNVLGITLGGEYRTNWPSGGSITETDPVFSASSAAGIGAGDIGNWNTAFGWGNWATDVAYLAALTNATMTESTVNGVAINGRTLAITVRTNYATGDASGWSGFPATQNVNMAGFAITNSEQISRWENAVITREGGGTIAAGDVYMLGGGSIWSNANAASAATSKGMLGLALGSSVGADGLLLAGRVAMAGFNPGDVLYLDTNDNAIAATRPTGSNNVVRIVGYALSSSAIMFQPDRTYIEILGD